MKTKIFILGLALTLQANFGAAQTAILPSENFKSDSGAPLSGWALANDSSLSSSLDSSKSSKSSGIATMAAADDTWTIDLTTPGKLSSTRDIKTARKLTITGVINARDVAFMRNEMPDLAELDLSKATIKAFNGLGGTFSESAHSYPENEMPEFSFYPPGNSRKERTALVKVVLPENLTSIGESSFGYCTGLAGPLVLPASLTAVKDYAFQECRGFTGELILPNTITTIGMYAFNYCKGLTGQLILPNSLTSIGLYAFSGCSGFTGRLIISESLKNLSSYAFRNCGFTDSLIIPNSVTTIGESVFYGCGFTGTIIFPESITFIGNGSFWDCKKLTGVVIRSAITAIGAQLFLGCTSLSFAVIPPSVNLIKTSAFAACSSLHDVVCFATVPPSVVASAFDSVTISKATLYVPCLSVQDYKNADSWKNFGEITCIRDTIRIAEVFLSKRIYDKTSTATVDSIAFTRTKDGSSAILNKGVHYTATVEYTDDKAPNAGLTGRRIKCNVKLATPADIVYVLEDSTLELTSGDEDEKYAIHPRPITLKVTGVKDIAYGAQVALGYSISSGTLLDGDSLISTLGSSGDTSTAGFLMAGKHFVEGESFGVADGNSGNNYEISLDNASLMFIVSPKEVAAKVEVNSKEYDGNRDVAISKATVDGVLSRDVVSLQAGAATFANANVADGKPVSFSPFALVGRDSANYLLTNSQPAGLAAAITPRPLSVRAAGGAAQEIIYGEDAKISWAAYADSTGGSKPLAAGHTLSELALKGADKNSANRYKVGRYGFDNVKVTASDGMEVTANYAVSMSADSVIIGKRALTVEAKIDDKEYDGNDFATIGSAALIGLLDGDTVALQDGAATFDGAGVADSRTVNFTPFTIVGKDADSYFLSNPQPAGLTAAIHPRFITINAIKPDEQVYGTLVTPACTITSGMLVEGDLFIGALTITGDTSTAGYLAAGLHTVERGTYSVADGSSESSSDGSSESSSKNYVITFIPVAFVVNKKEVTVKVEVDSKVYDGSSAATVRTTLTGTLPGDVVILQGGIATFDNANVAGSKLVSFAPFILTGADSASYALTDPQPAGLTADIKLRPLSIRAAGGATQEIIYGEDAQISWAAYADSTGNYRPLVQGHTMSSLTLKDADKNSANRYKVGRYGFDAASVKVTASDGTEVTANYAVGMSADSVVINKKALTVEVKISDKEYDGSDSAIISSVKLIGLLSGDTVTLQGGKATFGDASIGNGKPVSFTPFILTGKDTDSYFLSNPIPKDVVGNITPFMLTITPSSGLGKVYGEKDPELTFRVSGWRGSDADDSATIIKGSLSRDKGDTVGSYAINAGSLSAGAAYGIRIAPATFSITPAALTITPSGGQRKVYGDPDEPLSFTADGWKNGDELNESELLSGSLTRAAGDTVGVYEVMQGNLSAGSSYAVRVTPDTLFTITPAALTITPDGGQAKGYGEADPKLTFTISGWKFDDSLHTAITGALSRAEGEEPGLYDIVQGSLLAGSRSYDVRFTSGVKFEVTFSNLDMLKILPITDGEGNELGSEWEREDVSDSSVVFRSYIPCDKNFIKRLNINYALRLGVTDNPFAKAGEGSSSSEGGAGAYGAAKQILLDVSEPGRKVANITLRSTATGRPEFKQYVFEVEKYFGLFDVVNEHLGSIRVVDNNPAINKSGLEFSWCMWEQKEGDSWVKVGGNQLYYTAGMSIHDKFSSTDSMRVTLRTASGDYLKTCPDVSHSSDKGSATGEPLVEVYPNPVALGGIIKIKQNTPAGGNNGEAEIELLYATFYIFDTQGHLIRFGSVSSLNEGLTAPEAPGIYHLILEGKAGKKAIEIAVVRE